MIFQVLAESSYSSMKRAKRKLMQRLIDVASHDETSLAFSLSPFLHKSKRIAKMRKEHLACVIADVLLILVGIILLSTGLICTNQISYLRDYWQEIFAVSIYSVVIGVLAVLIAVALLYAVARRFEALTTLMSSGLMVIAVLAAVGTLILLVGQTNLRQASFNHTSALFNNYSNSDSIVSSKLTFARLQQDFQCCGVMQATDWQQKIAGNLSVPDSCCREVAVSCGRDALLDLARIYRRGCAEPIFAQMNQSYRILIGMLITVVVLAAVGAVTGVIFQRSVHESYQAM